MENKEVDNQELYARLNLSPEATDDDIKRAYRYWAQVYHPDKQQSLQMKDVATENFQRICEAYEILSDEHKRQIYDIYGMEGIKSGLELGPKLKSPNEIREEFQKMKKRQEEEKLSAHVRPSGSFLVNLSVPQFLNGDGILKGMGMSTEVQSNLSKKNTVVLGGNLGVAGKAGAGAATAMFRHQASSMSSVEIVARAGLQSLVGIQSSRNLSLHSTGTVGLSVSLKDGIVYLSNTWTRQLSEASTGTINLVLGADPSVAVGWQKKEEKKSAAGELKFGPTMFIASGHYTHHFSAKSHGRVGGRIGSNALEFEVGGGRRISEYSTLRMFCTIGIQGIFWRFEFNRAGQKLIIPVLLSKALDPLFATSALLIPSSLYAFAKHIFAVISISIFLPHSMRWSLQNANEDTYVVKPYYQRRERRKTLERRKIALSQVIAARERAMKAQSLLQNVAARKKSKQAEKGGWIINEAVYGNLKGQKSSDMEHIDESELQLPPPFLDVTIPLTFLVDDSGHLKLHEGIKKSGIMGFCDPCPGEPKQLKVSYTFRGHTYEVVVDDLSELEIPKDNHML